MTFIISAAATAELQLEGIIAAGITGVFMLLGVIWQSRKTRRVNTEEHNYNSTKLDQIETKLDRVDYRVDRVHGKLEDHIVRHERENEWTL